MATWLDRRERRRLGALLRSEVHAVGVRARPVPVEELCRRLSERRGRPIELIARRLPVPGPFGYWVARSGADEIIYQRDTTVEHRTHIVLHELAHILCGHDLIDEQALHHRDDDLLGADEHEPGRGPGDRAPISAAAAGFAARWNTLHRESYEDKIEREAELGASLLKRWVSAGIGASTADSGPDEGALRIQDALGDST